MSKFQQIIAGLKPGSRIAVYLSGGTELSGEVVGLDAAGILDLSTGGTAFSNQTFVDIDTIVAVGIAREIDAEGGA
jgi:hypothetical protein